MKSRMLVAGAAALITLAAAWLYQEIGPLDHDEPLVVDNAPLKIEKREWKATSDPKTWTRNFTSFGFIDLKLEHMNESDSVSRVERLKRNQSLQIIVRRDGDSATEDTLTFEPSFRKLTLTTTKIELEPDASGKYLQPKGGQNFRVKQIVAVRADDTPLPDDCGNNGCDNKFRRVNIVAHAR